ncbi:tRNA adenosine deaminase-associated protein [Rhodococcus sp. HNM0569]|uniref:tRNA adenosine deaminase-associated protein n=1 Tax=Rhodococcus sp. HNM0569 TaxID=2716340 RepID=UPI00146E69EE|nr:tRNA adenosine deaminase-associated protein [Rhodococcus sp. HNM0569]NLU83534.1 tRNA adenosine deaminase-associated protein [Rhodococcus sp. HNM0569]
MSAQRAGREDELDGFAVAVVFEDSRWKVKALGARALDGLENAERELLGLRSPGAFFGLLDVDEEFFVIVRPAPGGTRLLLSDATAAVDYDIAADVLERLNVDIPDLDPDEIDDTEPWEEGDLTILADLGLPEPVLAVIVGDTDLYPDEQFSMIAQRLGFDAELSAVLDAQE